MCFCEPQTKFQLTYNLVYQLAFLPPPQPAWCDYLLIFHLQRGFKTIVLEADLLIYSQSNNTTEIYFVLSLFVVCDIVIGCAEFSVSVFQLSSLLS